MAKNRGGASVYSGRENGTPSNRASEPNEALAVKKYVANLVLTKKANGSWRMCISFKDLNKAYPKDLYPLPKIDWKIESLMGFKYKCFLDAYKGYHQIQMSKKDEEKIVFHTDEGIFCYPKMPFGLKNARAIYQRLVDTIFEGQIGKNLEAYVDDMVIKSKIEQDLIQDIEETLLALKKVNMKLNPKQVFLQDGRRKVVRIYSNLRRNQGKPRKDQGHDKHALSKHIKKCTNKKDFHWTEAADEAFQTMKRLVAKLSTLTTPIKDEELMVYLLAADEAVSDVLLVERNGKQMSIHYMS
ncbi:reverse transcriptase domain-containing protein [Tanacetum coccineum]